LQSDSKFTLKKSSWPLVSGGFTESVETQMAGTKCKMRTIFQSLLLIAITFVYVPGAYATIEMNHSHEVSEGHGHQHTGDKDSHHPHDHEPVHSSELPENEVPTEDPHSHTHLVPLGVDNLFTLALHSTFKANLIGACQPVAISVFIADGPCFPLIKPPQLH
jgi:hypothetical protein